jgi:hypothetical protein
MLAQPGDDFEGGDFVTPRNNLVTLGRVGGDGGGDVGCSGSDGDGYVGSNDRVGDGDTRGDIGGSGRGGRSVGVDEASNAVTGSNRTSAAPDSRSNATTSASSATSEVTSARAFQNKGDAVVFVSHKQHNVQAVTQGVRHVLVVELWEGIARKCGHRCELASGPCEFRTAAALISDHLADFTAEERAAANRFLKSGGRF